MKKASSTPFGYKAELFERRRDAEKRVEDLKGEGKQAWWRVWGKRYKVYFERT